MNGVFQFGFFFSDVLEFDILGKQKAEMPVYSISPLDVDEQAVRHPDAGDPEEDEDEADRVPVELESDWPRVEY